MHLRKTKQKVDRCQKRTEMPITKLKAQCAVPWHIQCADSKSDLLSSFILSPHCSCADVYLIPKQAITWGVQVNPFGLPLILKLISILFRFSR